MSTFRIVRLQAPTTDTTQDYTASDFGDVNPDVVLVWAAGEGNNTLNPNVSVSMGWYTGSLAQVLNMYALDGNTIPAGTGRESKNGRVVSWNEDSATEKRWATPTLITNGVRLTWTTETGFTPSDHRPWVTVLLIKGVTALTAGEGSPPEDATTAADSPADTITTTGVDPDLIFVMYAGQAWPSSSGGGFHVSWGFAYDNGATIDQRCMGFKRNNDDDPTESGCYFNDSNVAMQWTGTNTSCRAEMFIDSMGTDGFNIKERALGSKAGFTTGTEFAYLALQLDDIPCEVFNTTLPTASGDWTIKSGLGVVPQAVLLWNPFSTTELDGEGAYHGATMYVATKDDAKEGGWACHDENGVSTTNSQDDAITAYKSYTDDGTLDLTASSPVFGSNSIVVADANVDTASQATLVFGLAFGGGAAGGEDGANRGIMRGVGRGVG